MAAPETSCFPLLFYRAVRDLKPRSYNPSEALLYAIVHDHQPYARYLLSHHAEEALSRPGERFFCCSSCRSCASSSSSPHLAMTVRYDRRYILGLILREARRCSVQDHHHRVQDHHHHHRGGGGGCCPHDAAEGGGKTPLHLACELARPEAVALLLGHGASPRVQDHRGRTPLDLLLARFREPGGGGGAERRRCLDNLLMFMSSAAEGHDFQMRDALDREPGFWSEALGDVTFQYLVGRTPAALVLAAMRTVLRQLSPAGFPDSLEELPIPSSLKPLSPPSSSSSSSGQHRERSFMSHKSADIITACAL
ncbi:hypothetical protein CRUP_022262 [Coryphaenoides rupestris]|nr:hypothetical protein CRUP_022262 [Coryphaenoides rupestris]